MTRRRALSGAGIAGLAVGLIVGGVIVYALATAIPLGKPYTLTETVTSSTASPSLPSGRVTYVSLLPGAGENRSVAGFSPATIVVVIGVNNTVVWANNDKVPHTVTPVAVPSGASWPEGSGNLDPGQAYAHTFTAQGTYSYACTYHTWMHGKIVVMTGPGP